MGGDLADAPRQAQGAQMTRHHDNAMTRRDRTPPVPAFSLMRAQGQPSAWSRGALYGGSLTLLALVMALGYTTVRPTPRRRHPIVPAPARRAGRSRR
jgi:hypothetical protein